MQVHLVDGTYELFRYHFAPNNKDPDKGATRGVLGSVLMLLESGATHVGVATDHVIESFRNDLWPGYKTSAGMPPELLAQFGLLEDVLMAAGITTWPMVELEADDALGAAARVAAADERVEQVLICTPDKDLGQCVGGKVVQWDRRRDLYFDAAGVRDKFGVDPGSIPDYLALVGDSADGFPGLAGLRRPLGRSRARQVRAPREDPRRRRRLGRRRPQPGPVGRDVARQLRARAAVPAHRDARVRRGCRSRMSTSCAGPGPSASSWS